MIKPSTMTMPKTSQVIGCNRSIKMKHVRIEMSGKIGTKGTLNSPALGFPNIFLNFKSPKLTSIKYVKRHDVR